MAYLKATRKKGIMFFQFSKYLMVGIIVTLLNILFMWLAIDILKFETKISAAIILIFLFFAKFYTYVTVNLIHKNFYKFMIINIISIILNWFFSWILIDFIGISAAITSMMIVTTLFILRFIGFKIIGILR